MGGGGHVGACSVRGVRGGGVGRRKWRSGKSERRRWRSGEEDMEEEEERMKMRLNNAGVMRCITRTNQPTNQPSNDACMCARTHNYISYFCLYTKENVLWGCDSGCEWCDVKGSG